MKIQATRHKLPSPGHRGHVSKGAFSRQAVCTWMTKPLCTRARSCYRQGAEVQSKGSNSSKGTRDKATSCNSVPWCKNIHTHQTPIADAPVYPSITVGCRAETSPPQIPVPGSEREVIISPLLIIFFLDKQHFFTGLAKAKHRTGTGHPRKLLVMGNKCFSKQQAQEERQRMVQESSLIAIQLSLNDSCPSLPIPGRPNYQHFLLTIEIFETFGLKEERNKLPLPSTQCPMPLDPD